MLDNPNTFGNPIPLPPRAHTSRIIEGHKVKKVLTKPSTRVVLLKINKFIIVPNFEPVWCDDVLLATFSCEQNC